MPLSCIAPPFRCKLPALDVRYLTSPLASQSQIQPASRPRFVHRGGIKPRRMKHRWSWREVPLPLCSKSLPNAGEIVPSSVDQIGGQQTSWCCKHNIQQRNTEEAHLSSPALLRYHQSRLLLPSYYKSFFDIGPDAEGGSVYFSLLCRYSGSTRLVKPSLPAGQVNVGGQSHDHRGVEGPSHSTARSSRY